jgi:DNA polymerase IV
MLSMMAILAHVDLDAFFAAVEELEQPELKAQPLVVGGDPQGRGVVATANYVARRFGIRSAMSAAEALRRCPHAVFLRPRHALYREYSQAVWSAIGEVVPLVERTGLDEGYLDFAGLAADFARARAVAEAVQVSVRAATSLSCSLGVAPTKVVAKIASDRRKPGGITVVPAGTEAAFLAPFAVRALPGVGPRAEERLRAAGVTTIGRLAALSDLDLRAVLPPARSAASSATAPAGSTRAASRPRRSGSRSPPRRRSSATCTTAGCCTRSCGAWRRGWPSTCAATASRRGR